MVSLNKALLSPYFWRGGTLGSHEYMGVEPKIGFISPKMDGENNGKAYEQMDDLGGFPIIFGNTHIYMVYLPTCTTQINY